jgi:iron complex transport system substrate-binding protein
MGRDLEYNLEYLVAKKPGLVLQSGIEGQFNPDPRLAEIGIPVLYILEWMEPTPLGRSEWIRVFGMLTGKVREADSLFAIIEKDYLALSELGHGSQIKPLILTGTNFKGTWYMPGGRNYQARFFEDAGMEYPYKLTKQSASLALSFETVVNDLGEAPVWVGTTTDSLSQLLAAEERYAIFRAVKSKKVYSITNRVNANGGNDYWESGVVRPDKVLADLLFIAHPELLPGHAWNYYKPMIFN